MAPFTGTGAAGLGLRSRFRLTRSTPAIVTFVGGAPLVLAKQGEFCFGETDQLGVPDHAVLVIHALINLPRDVDKRKGF